MFLRQLSAAFGFALALTIAISIVHAKGDAKPENPETPLERAEHDFARAISAYELQKRHWSFLDQKQFTTLNDRISEAGFPEELTRRWKASLINMTNVGETETKPDEFEKSAIETFKAGKTEAWQTRDEKMVRYARAVRAQQNCITCHQGESEVLGIKGKALKTGDIIRVVSLQFSDKEAKP
jgi:Protein of unknown function (DUF3365)